MMTLFGANTCDQRFVKKWKLFLIKPPEILRHETFLFFLHADFTYFLKWIPFKKIPWNLKSFFIKISPLRIFQIHYFKLNCLFFKIPTWQNFKIRERHNFIKTVNRDYGIWGHQICFVKGKSSRKQALSKSFNTAHSRKKKANSGFVKPWK